MWSEHQWDTCASVLQRGFAARDDLEPADLAIYKLLLVRLVEPDVALNALTELVVAGQKWRPTPSEIVERCLRDASRPAFETEVLELLFGRHGITRVQPPPRGLWREGERQAAIDRLAAKQLATMHPLVASFVQRVGLEWLRALRYEISDAEVGQWRRKDLRRAWDEHVEAFDGREVAAIAAGTGSEGMRRLDPLVGLSELEQQRARGELHAVPDAEAS